MHKKLRLWIGIIMFAILALLIIWTAHKPLVNGTAMVSGMPTITAFSAEAGTFYVTGGNLAHVQIWSIPTGTGIAEKDYQEIGEATLATTTDSIQVWTLPVPAQPIVSAQIFAKGFGGGADAADAPARMILPYQGASEINDALWGTGSTTVSQ